jgi:hypothetical protein
MASARSVPAHVCPIATMAMSLDGRFLATAATRTIRDEGMPDGGASCEGAALTVQRGCSLRAHLGRLLSAVREHPDAGHRGRTPGTACLPACHRGCPPPTCLRRAPSLLTSIHRASWWQSPVVLVGPDASAAQWLKRTGQMRRRRRSSSGPARPDPCSLCARARWLRTAEAVKSWWPSAGSAGGRCLTLTAGFARCRPAYGAACMLVLRRRDAFVTVGATLRVWRVTGAGALTGTVAHRYASVRTLFGSALRGWRGPEHRRGAGRTWHLCRPAGARARLPALRRFHGRCGQRLLCVSCCRGRKPSLQPAIMACRPSEKSNNARLLHSWNVAARAISTLRLPGHGGPSLTTGRGVCAAVAVQSLLGQLVVSGVYACACRAGRDRATDECSSGNVSDGSQTRTVLWASSLPLAL